MTAIRVFLYWLSAVPLVCVIPVLVWAVDRLPMGSRILDGKDGRILGKRIPVWALAIGVLFAVIPPYMDASRHLASNLSSMLRIGVPISLVLESLALAMVCGYLSRPFRCQGLAQILAMVASAGTAAKVTQVLLSGG